jgi:transcriptional regulator GlxA family with amidase domain
VSPEFTKFVRERTEEVKALFTTCTGAMVAAAMGILDGVDATTNHGIIPMVGQVFPKAKWTSERQWVVDESGAW